MDFYNKKYKPVIGERVKLIRKFYGKKQKEFGNESTVSQIENGTKDINANVLFNIKQSTGLTYERILFNDVDNFVKDLFNYFLSLILYKDFDKITDNRYSGEIDYTDIVVQKSCLELVKTFSEFNIQRRNFVLSNETIMDTFDKEYDFFTILNGKIYNPARDREQPINESTVIDFEKMNKTLWFIIKNKMIKSFSTNVCNSLFKEDCDGYLTNFSISNIDKKINLWWEKVVAIEIIPQTINKLKNNPLFNIGFIVDNILTNMVKDNITPSYLTSVPLRLVEEDGFEIKTSTKKWFTATEEEKEEIKAAEKEVNKFYIGEISLADLHSKFSIEKLKSFGIEITMTYKQNNIEQVSFDEVLQMVKSSKATSTIKNNPEIASLSPFYDITKRKLKELPTNMNKEETENQIIEIISKYDMPLDSNNVYRKIEGLLQENKAVVNYFQEQLNESLLSMAHELNRVQQAFLTLISEEELIEWAL